MWNESSFSGNTRWRATFFTQAQFITLHLTFSDLIKIKILKICRPNMILFFCVVRGTLHQIKKWIIWIVPSIFDDRKKLSRKCKLKTKDSLQVKIIALLEDFTAIFSDLFLLSYIISWRSRLNLSLQRFYNWQGLFLVIYIYIYIYIYIIHFFF